MYIGDKTKKSSVFAGVFFILLVAAFTLLTSVKGKEKVPQLQVKGTTLTAAGSDAPVRFKGVSLGWHNLWPRFYNEKAVENLIKDWGAGVVRASIGADNLHETGDNLGYISDPETALKCLYAAVDGAVNAGAYVIVDWHSHVLHMDEATEFFTAVADKYKDCPNVIYELFNEPIDDSWADLKAYAESLINTITGISRVHPLILMGCPRWDQSIDLPATDPIVCYDNLMYTMHFYAGTHGQWLRDRTDQAMADGMPVFISECAAVNADGDGPIAEDKWAEWSNWADDRGLSIVVWSISDKDESCSMFTKQAASEGPWSDEVIKPWGKIVKDWLKK